METEMKQLQYETDTWKRSLGFMIDENIYLKNRLTEILKNGFDKKLLEQLEYFQTRFIKEDERIGLIRNDIAEIDRILDIALNNDGKILKETSKKVANIRNNVSHGRKPV